MREMSKKIENLVSHILEECETRGLTLDEIKKLPVMLSRQVSLHTSNQEKTVEFKVVSHSSFPEN